MRAMLTEAGPATREVGEAAGPLAEAWAAGAALREAEQLMAHTEPEAIRADGAIFAGWQAISASDAERQARGGRLGSEERAALAEAIRDFVLCPALPRGYGLSVYDCACGGCNNGRAIGYGRA